MRGLVFDLEGKQTRFTAMQARERLRRKRIQGQLAAVPPTTHAEPTDISVGAYNRSLDRLYFYLAGVFTTGGVFYACVVGGFFR